MHFRLAISRKKSKIISHLHPTVGCEDKINPNEHKIIMKTISVLALTAVAILASCQQQQQQQQNVEPVPAPVPAQTVTK